MWKMAAMTDINNGVGVSSTPAPAEKKYYDYSTILNTPDINGKKAGIYIITSNRSAGKTTGALKISLERYRERGEHTVLFFRDVSELKASRYIYDDVVSLYPELGGEITSEIILKDTVIQLMIDGDVFAHAVTIKKPDPVKKYSAIFHKTTLGIFDECFLESGCYIPNEVANFQSILLTVARGGGEQSRPIECLMLGNLVSNMNPYFIKMKIISRLDEIGSVGIIRGKGWVLHREYNESAARAVMDNPIVEAFGDSSYSRYAVTNTELHNSSAFITRFPKAKNHYLATLAISGRYFCLRDFYTQGFLYIGSQYEKKCNRVLVLNNDEHDIERILITRQNVVYRFAKDAYLSGMVRFEDLEAKEAFFDFLSIDPYGKL